jgi:hypothetical protein
MNWSAMKTEAQTRVTRIQMPACARIAVPANLLGANTFRNLLPTKNEIVLQSMRGLCNIPWSSEKRLIFFGGDGRIMFRDTSCRRHGGRVLMGNKTRSALGSGN